MQNRQTTPCAYCGASGTLPNGKPCHLCNETGRTSGLRTAGSIIGGIGAGLTALVYGGFALAVLAIIIIAAVQ